MEREKVILIDFGGRYNQLTARRIREMGIYCEIMPLKSGADRLKKAAPSAIVLAGGQGSAEDDAEATAACMEILSAGFPVLGICYGARIIAKCLGAQLVSDSGSVFEEREVIPQDTPLFKGINRGRYMTCGISVVKVGGRQILPLAYDGDGAVCAFKDKEREVYGISFQPVTDTGAPVLENFLKQICHITGGWTVKNFAADMTAQLTHKLKDKKVLCALSGGVDSAVAATMVHRAAGEGLTCIFVDHGLLRKNEAQQVMQVFKHERGMNVIKIDAQDRFLDKLEGIDDPETKRKIIGGEFIRVFEEAARFIGKVDYLVQGTIYPDVLESGFLNNPVVKSHHNVGGLPSVVDFKEIVEPLRELFKDEVREVGLELGLPREIVMRQPFPGPGLGVRVVGAITREKLRLLADADHILREEIALAGLDRSIWQYFAVIIPVRSVGVKDSARTYGYTIALRAVHSSDGMTAKWAHIPFDVLEKISSRICGEVDGISRVVYDITSKPPATIEWE